MVDDDGYVDWDKAMKFSFPMIPLGEILSKSEEWIELDPSHIYQQVTIKMWGQGVVQRNEVAGAEIAATRRFVVRPQQFILSRIDARNGGLGIVPQALDGAVVSNDFPAFNLNTSRILPEYLGWMSKTHSFVELCKAASEGTTNRVRLQEDLFLSLQIPLPPLAEQRRIVARIEELAAKIEEARGLRASIDIDIYATLLGAYRKIVHGVPQHRMDEVAPLQRRAVDVKLDKQYHELGIRSFGKGTFHKPAITGANLGTKKVFWLKPGDLVFNIVFAWEGAVAVVKPENDGRIGSHRFLACIPKEGIATAHFLWFHFITESGLRQLGEASPGGAGRNRTLGLEALAKINVPLPTYEKQLWFDHLFAKIDALKALQAETQAELDALLPSVLDKAFKGEL